MAQIRRKSARLDCSRQETTTRLVGKGEYGAEFSDTHDRQDFRFCLLWQESGVASSHGHSSFSPRCDVPQSTER